MKAYVNLRSVWQTMVVEYQLGPVVVRLDAVAVGWYRNSFRPAPINATKEFGGPQEVQVGDGVSSQGAGSFVRWSILDDVTIAVPDEMKTSPIPPRTLEHGKDFLVFYGSEQGAGLPATRSSNTLVVGAGHTLRDGELVTVRSTGTLPAGLVPDRLYYVTGRTSTAVSLALTPGGSVVTLSDAGTGTHEVVPFRQVAMFDMADRPNYSNEAPLR